MRDSGDSYTWFSVVKLSTFCHLWFFFRFLSLPLLSPISICYAQLCVCVCVFVLGICPAFDIVFPNRSFNSVTQLCLTICDPMNCSTPGLPVHHQLPEFTQTHVHWVSDATQPSHPLSFPSPPALNISQHQGLFKWVLEFLLQMGHYRVLWWVPCAIEVGLISYLFYCSFSFK